MVYKNQEISLNPNNSTIKAMSCTTDTGFSFCYNAMNKSGMLSIRDERLTDGTCPVAMISEVPFYSDITDIETIVAKAIHLYKNYQTILIASSLQELETAFSQAA